MTSTEKRSKKTLKNIRELRGQLLEWYDRHARELPWRARSGEVPDPYHVWLSEIMLQQTTVQAVKPYYTKFLTKWPEIHDLAAAEQEEVMAAWAGLGYYARARNLHKCAKVVSEELDGTFPDAQAELKKLPGIGDYTSAAVAAIAFNKPATVVDGNVERVMARLFNVREPMPASKPKLKALAGEFFDGFEEHPGDLAQSLMDLGATICIPKAPRCSLCPLNEGCDARKKGDPEKLPFKSPKKPRPQKHGYVYWIENDRGEILLHKREEKGLLGGMVALPTSEWVKIDATLEDADSLELAQSYKDVFVDHVFTHFDLKLYLKTARAKRPEQLPDGFFWAKPEGGGDAMPSVFQKAFRLFHEGRS